MLGTVHRIRVDLPDRSQGSVLEPGTLFETRAPAAAASHIRVLGTEGRVWGDVGNRKPRVLAGRRHVRGESGRPCLSAGPAWEVFVWGMPISGRMPQLLHCVQ